MPYFDYSYLIIMNRGKKKLKNQGAIQRTTRSQTRLLFPNNQQSIQSTATNKLIRSIDNRAFIRGILDLHKIIVRKPYALSMKNYRNTRHSPILLSWNRYIRVLITEPIPQSTAHIFSIFFCACSRLPLLLAPLSLFTIPIFLISFFLSLANLPLPLSAVIYHRS